MAFDHPSHNGYINRTPYENGWMMMDNHPRCEFLSAKNCQQKG